VDDDRTVALAGAVMTLVNRVRRGQARAANPELVVVLELLREHGALTSSQIAELLPAPRSSVSRRVKTLTEAGWAELTASASDGRSYTVALSESGAAHLAALTSEGLAVFAELIADWSDEDVDTYITLTRRLVAVTPTAARPRRKTTWWKEQPR
jgi:DNA-binding MarR family transcriptional regulator